MITLEQAKKLKIGDTLYHLQNQNADDSPQRWRVNGKVKRWIREPDRIEVPLKHGLNDYFHLGNYHLSQFHLEADCEEQHKRKNS